MQIVHESGLLDILRLWNDGLPMSRIARDVGVDRKTVRKYVRAAEAAGLRPGAPPEPDDVWAARAHELFPAVMDRSKRQSTWAEIDRHRDRVATLSATHSVAAMYRTLRDEHGLSASLASFRRYLRAQTPSAAGRNPRAAPAGADRTEHAHAHPDDRA